MRVKDVRVTINMVKPIGHIGFGCPLILEEHATTEKAYAEYSSLEAVVTAGYTETSNVYKAAQLMFAQNHAPESIAICSITGAAEAWVAVQENVCKDWRQLVVLNANGESPTNVSGIMAAVEAETTYPKLYFANVDIDESTITDVEDIERTLICYYTPTENVPSPVAAIAGEVGGLNIGSYTINNLVVNGVPPLDLSETEVQAIHAKGGVTIVMSADDCVVTEGKAAGGSYIDNTDNNDWIKQQLEYKTQKVLNNNLKIPYTNAGIAMLESAAVEVMTDAVNKTIIDNFTVHYLKREEVDEEDRQARRYIGGNITYSMAGAIHNVEIACECNL